MAKKFTPTQIAQRDAFEAQFAGLPAIDPTVLKLLTAEGFALCFMEIRELYPTKVDAYERLEDIRIGLTGRRYYSSYHSFRRVLDRNLKSGWKR